MHALDGQRVQAVYVERSAFHHDSGNTDEIEDAFGKWHTVACGQNEIDETALVGNEEEGAAGGDTEFCAKGVIVSVGVSAEKTIGVGEFATESCDFSTHRFAGEKFEVPVAGHFLRFWQVRDKPLDLGERHAVQAVVVTELESSQ